MESVDDDVMAGPEVEKTEESIEAKTEEMESVEVKTEEMESVEVESEETKSDEVEKTEILDKNGSSDEADVQMKPENGSSTENIESSGKIFLIVLMISVKKQKHSNIFIAIIIVLFSNYKKQNMSIIILF